MKLGSDMVNADFSKAVESESMVTVQKQIAEAQRGGEYYSPNLNAGSALT